MTDGIFKELFFKDFFLFLLPSLRNAVGALNTTFKRQAQRSTLFVLPP